MTSDPGRRLHRAAIGAEAFDALRRAAIPIVLVALVGGGAGDRRLLTTLAIAVVGGAVAVLVAWLRWEATRWWIEADSVRLRTGLLSENVTTVPLERVQAVDTVRGPVQRLFGVVELHVQAAGGGRRGEIVLKAVTPREAEELREAVRRGSGRPDLAHPEHAVPPYQGQRIQGEPRAEWRLGTRPLLQAAVTSGSLGLLVPIVAGASQVLDDVVGVDDAERLLPETAGAALVAAAVVLAIAWVLSVLGTVMAFAGFCVRRDGERLRIRRGVVETREASVPVGRVHALRIIENPLREPFGLATVRIETAGYAREAATAQTLLPLVRRADVARVLDALLPELDVAVDGLEPLPRRAARRYLLPPAVVVLAAAAGVTVAFGAPGLAVLALLVPAAAFGLARYRTAGWRMDGGRLVLRTRGLTRTTAGADGRRLQSLGTAATPFQRRARLATLFVDVSSGRRLALRHLDEDVAGEILGRLREQATAPPPAA